MFPVDDEMYEEYKKYEETYLREKQKKQFKSKTNDINVDIFNGNETNDIPISAKVNIDSAYSRYSLFKYCCFKS